MVGESTVQTKAATPSFDTKENLNCTHSVLTTSSSPVYTQSLLQGPPPLSTPYLLNARQLGVYTPQAPPHLLEPTMPTSVLPTMVQPTPAPVPSAFGTQQAVGYAAPQHNVAVTPATGLGVSVAPVAFLLEQVTQPIVVTAPQTTPHLQPQQLLLAMQLRAQAFFQRLLR